MGHKLISDELVKFFQNLKQPKKDANNPFFNSKYVPLENVVEAVNAAIKDTKLSYIQMPVSDDKGNIGVKTIIMSGDDELAFEPFYLPTKKNDAQAYGSTLTYARRYSLAAAFGITSEDDDDANSASGQGSKTTSAKKKPAKKQSSSNMNEFKRAYAALGSIDKDTQATAFATAKAKAGVAGNNPSEEQLKIMATELGKILNEFEEKEGTK